MEMKPTFPDPEILEYFLAGYKFRKAEELYDKMQALYAYEKASMRRTLESKTIAEFVSEWLKPENN